MAELSEASGVPLSSLSKLELGQLNLTYDKLMRLSRALGADFSDIVENESAGAPPPGRRAVVPAGSGQRVKWGPHKALVSATELLSKAFTPVMLEVKARTLREHGPMTRLTTETYLLAIDGELTLHLESYAPLGMRPGDGVYFDGRTPHAVLTASGRPCTALLVASPEEPEFS